MSATTYVALASQNGFKQIVDLEKIAELLDGAQVIDGRKILIKECGDPMLYREVLTHVYSQIDRLVHETEERQRLMGPSARLIEDRIHKISRHINFSKWEKILRVFSSCCCSCGFTACLEEKTVRLIENHYS